MPEVEKFNRKEKKLKIFRKNKTKSEKIFHKGRNKIMTKKITK